MQRCYTLQSAKIQFFMENDGFGLSVVLYLFLCLYGKKSFLSFNEGIRACVGSSMLSYGAPFQKGNKKPSRKELGLSFNQTLSMSRSN